MRSKFIVCITLLCITAGFLGAAEKVKKTGLDYSAIDKLVDGGAYDKAIAAIEKDGKDPKKAKIYVKQNDVLYNLDKGLVAHYAGKYDVSFTNLEDAERLIAEYGADAASRASLDLAKAYEGEIYESIYDSVFNALNNYNKGDIEGARVEARQINEKLTALLQVQRAELAQAQADAEKQMQGIDKVPVRPVVFNSSALGSYLTMVLLRGYSDVGPFAAQITNAYNVSKNVYNHPVPASIAAERSVPNGQARINIIGFTGLSPVKEDEKIEKELQGLTFLTRALQTAAAASGGAVDLAYVGQTFETKTLNYNVPSIKANKGSDGTWTTVPRSSEIDRIEVKVGDQTITLELLEDMGRVAYETFETKRAAIQTRTYRGALAKTVTAGIAVGTARAVVMSKAGANPIQTKALEAAVNVAEKSLDTTLATPDVSDTRMVRYLPNKAYVGGVNVAPGAHEVTITYYKGGTVIGKPVVTTIEAKANQPNIVEVINLK
ncbi:MAG: hypothetical protein LBJ31_07705 [Treponema sp.]|jgi:hypothetical protein|nr:hypothetical protein [Treponema sp.]